MFKLRREQWDALVAAARARVPDELVRDLRAEGAPVERDPATGAAVHSDARGEATRLTFRPDGLPHRLVQPSGAETGFDYDARGRLAAVTYPTGRRVELARDADARVISLTQTGLATYRFGYDAAGRLASVTAPDGASTRITYTAAGRVASLRDRTGATCAYEYVELATLAGVTDPLGRTTRFRADPSGALAAVEFPDGSVQRFAFDAERNAGVVTGRDGGVTTHELSAAGELQRLVWPDGSWVAFESDAAGGLAAIRGVGGAVEYEHDAEGRMVAERGEAGAVRYAYDAEGRMVRLATPFGDEVRFDYDVDGRLARVTDWSGAVTRVLHDAEDAIVEISTPNGLTELRTVGPHRRPTQVRVVDVAGLALSEQRYEYDALERLVGAHDSGADGRGAVARSYGYDAESRLLREVERRRGVPPVESDYAYDRKGNLLRIGTLRVEIGPMDEPRRFGESDVEYDAAGNAVRLPGAPGELHCRYGADGTLRECTVGDRRWRFQYDCLGRRIGKTDGVESWRYGWSGPQLLWEELRGQPGAAPVRRDYLFLPGTLLPLAFREEGRTCWLQTDPRGAVVRAFDEDGSVVWAAHYDAFGAAVEEVAQIRQPFRLLGQYHDRETGLHYSLARYYSPQLRSYLSRDPRWTHPLATNYSYCRNDPWNRADPLGTFAPLLLAGLAVVAAGAVIGAVTADDPVAGAVDGAIASAGALVAMFTSAPLVAVIGVGALAAGVGAFAGQMVKRERRGGDLCVECALEAAGVAAITDLVLLGLGRIPGVRNLGRSLARRALGSKIARFSGAESAAAGARLRDHLRQLERYGKTGVRELENGKIRYYGFFEPASKPGEMTGRRLVREWDPVTGADRTWHETLDGSGRIRIVRPQVPGPKRHHVFDRNGRYEGVR
jgi:RHS repeat-associated protein